MNRLAIRRFCLKHRRLVYAAGAVLYVGISGLLMWALNEAGR